jgi:hypothetical protein
MESKLLVFFSSMFRTIRVLYSCTVVLGILVGTFLIGYGVGNGTIQFLS